MHDNVRMFSALQAVYVLCNTSGSLRYIQLIALLEKNHKLAVASIHAVIFWRPALKSQVFHQCNTLKAPPIKLVKLNTCLEHHLRFHNFSPGDLLLKIDIIIMQDT